MYDNVSLGSRSRIVPTTSTENSGKCGKSCNRPKTSRRSELCRVGHRTHQHERRGSTRRFHATRPRALGPDISHLDNIFRIFGSRAGQLLRRVALHRHDLVEVGEHRRHLSPLRQPHSSEPSCPWGAVGSGMAAHQGFVLFLQRMRFELSRRRIRPCALPAPDKCARGRIISSILPTPPSAPGGGRAGARGTLSPA